MQILPKNIFLVSGPLIFVILELVGPPAGMSHAAFSTLAATLWIAIWWMSEALPIGITSLLPLLLFPLTGVMSMSAAAEPYSRSIIFLFIGGFIIALAMEKWNLHRRIALTILSIVGTRMKQIILGFVVATGGLSMWISNTATTVMMLPIALSIVHQLRQLAEQNKTPIKGADQFDKALVLSIAYAASIGGMATLIGTPTNLIFAESVKEFYEVEIPFDEWFAIGLPISVVLLMVCWWYLSNIAFKIDNKKIEGSEGIIKKQLVNLGKMSKEEKWVLGIFLLVAFAWMSRRFLIAPFFPAVNDTHVVLIGALFLYIIPAPSAPKEQLMDWPTTLKLPWGVLLLFGGAFAVAAAFEASGLTEWIGGKLGLLKGVPYWVILLVVVAGVNFLTELTMNMATCTLMMPILAAFAVAADFHPFGLMAATSIAASCAFMLPVATAPNAVVFGSGFLKVSDMARAGFRLNLISILVIVLFIYFLFPIVWGIDVLSFPEGLGTK